MGRVGNGGVKTARIEEHMRGGMENSYSGNI